MEDRNAVAFGGTIVSYKETEMLWIHPKGSFSQHFILFSTYKQALKARVLHYILLEMHACYKHSSLSGPIVSYK